MAPELVICAGRREMAERSIEFALGPALRPRRTTPMAPAMLVWARVHVAALWEGIFDTEVYCDTHAPFRGYGPPPYGRDGDAMRAKAERQRCGKAFLTIGCQAVGWTTSRQATNIRYPVPTPLDQIFEPISPIRSGTRKVCPA